MSEQYWYVYQQGQQIGPFGEEQLQQMLLSKMISHDAYLFKVGWRDWRPIEECQQELGVSGGGAPQVAEATERRRDGAPRATIQGRVIVHNNGQLVIGAGVNISPTGIFIETLDQLFTIGEQLKLSVRCEGFTKAFNVTAQVMRFNSDKRWPVGYGLRFEGLDASVSEEIERLVGLANGKAKGQSTAVN